MLSRSRTNVLHSHLVVFEITSSVFLTWHEPVRNRSFFKLHWTDDKTIGNAKNRVALPVTTLIRLLESVTYSALLLICESTRAIPMSQISIQGSCFRVNISVIV